MATETESIIRSLLISTPLRCTVKQLCADFRNTVGYNIPIRKLGVNNVEEYLRSIPNTVQILGSGDTAEVRAVVTEKSAHIDKLVAKQRKDTIPAHKRKQLKKRYEDEPLPKPESSQDFFKRENSDFKTSPQFQDGYRSKVPKEVQNNLRKLIMQFPEGIWCTKLKGEYYKMFKQDLCFQKYRYKSLIELCTDLPEIFRFIQPRTDDFMLYDRSKPIPSVSQNEVKEEDGVDDKLQIDLSPINWSLGSSLVPSDIVYLSEEIPRLSLHDIKQGDHVDVVIGEIYDINNFWMFFKYSKLSALLEELQMFFRSQRNRFVIPQLFMTTGLYCTVLYKDEYHRSVIVDTLAKLPGYVQVLFIDYGSIGRVRTSDVWYLPKQFGKLPCQAIKGRLACVQSKRSELLECTAKFTDLVTDSELVGEVVKINVADTAIDIYLADIRDEDHIFYINDLLVEKGLAEYRD